MLFGEKYHRWIFIFGLFLCAASLSLGKFLIGTSLFTIVINWFLEATRPDPVWIHYGKGKEKFTFRSFFRGLLEENFKPKWRLFRARPSIGILMGVVVLHFIGILWSPDYAAAWNDLKIKLPLLLVPLVIGTTRPVNKRTFEFLLLTFVVAVFVSAVITILVAKGIIHPKKPVLDLRHASIFVPLIRLSLMCVLSVFFLGRWIIRVKNPVLKIAAMPAIAAFIWFLLYMQSLTGLVILFAGGFVLLVVMGFLHRKKKLSLLLLVLFVAGTTAAGVIIRRVYNEFYTMHPVDAQHLKAFTSRGHPYVHELNYPMIENGNSVMVYVCWSELDSAWNSRSNTKLNGGKDVNGNPVYMTLLRYLASKGWRKDADAISRLSDAEIKAIENGATNARDPERSSIERRIYQVFWEMYHYRHGANPSGNSVTMRLELGKTALFCIAQHPWIGVGTGGQQKAFHSFYEKEGTQLDEEFQWLHAHNQLLSVTVCLGIPALLYFLFSLWYAPYSMKRWRSYLYLAFFLVCFLSFFDDDTLETSQGVNFFAFFNALLLYSMPRESAINTETEIKTENQE